VRNGVLSTHLPVRALDFQLAATLIAKVATSGLDRVRLGFVDGASAGGARFVHGPIVATRVTVLVFGLAIRGG
jgi:hypothetical protein